MKLTNQQIKDLVEHPEQASSGEERRLLKLLSGKGRAFNPEEKKAQSYAQQYKEIHSKKASRVHSKRKRSRANSLGKICIDCSAVIPIQRASIEGVVRCVPCQSRWERSNPGIVERRVDEGIAGTREDNQRTRNNNSGDLQRRRNEF
jgi:RNA polymerase-binding transcription factor DksA